MQDMGYDKFGTKAWPLFRRLDGAVAVPLKVTLLQARSHQQLHKIELKIKKYLTNRRATSKVVTEFRTEDFTAVLTRIERGRALLFSSSPRVPDILQSLH